MTDHKDMSKPVRDLECCCCGERTRGRQWWNRDTGYGLCIACIEYCATRMPAEEFDRCYGVRGVHYALG
jgi:hypothetical protein